MDLFYLRTPTARYGMAVFLIVVDVAVRWTLTPIMDDRGAALFAIPAVLLSAMLGGFGPGLVATILGALLVDLVLLLPVGSLLVNSPADWVRLGVFSAVGITVSWLGEFGRRIQQSLKEQKEALERSEERLRLAADAARIGMFEWNVRTNQSVWTTQLETLHGMEPGTYSGTYEQWLACLHPEDRIHAERRIREALETGVHEAEWRIVRPDGSVRWMEARGWLYRDAEGNPVRMIGVNIDVTARKEAEQAVIASEANFRALIEHAPEAVFVANREGVYCAANANVSSLLGYAPEEFVGKRIQDLIRPEELPRLEGAKAAPPSDAPRVAEWEMRHKDGHYVSLELSARLLPDNRWVSFARDISRRKAVESALRESEARFREMADTVPGMLWITEPDGHCSFLSREWYEFTGQENSAGHELNWTEMVHPEDRQEAGRAFLEANEKRESFRCEYRLRCADGEYRWTMDSGRPRHAQDGGFCGMVGVVIDIHERRQVEEKLRTLAAVVENCGDFIGICTPEMKVVYVNEAGRRMVGFQSVKEALEIPVLDYFWPEDRARIEAEGLPVLRETGRWVGEVRFRNFQTGEAIHTLWNAFVINDKHGVPIAWATVSPNLNAVKAAEAAARSAMEIAEAASRAKDAFLAALSHELRTPLNPVLMLAAEQAKNEELQADIRADFALIHQNVGLEVRLIDDLLDLTRITQGKLEMRQERCRAHELLTASLEILEGDLAAKQLTVTSEFSALNDEMQGDPVRLQQVFWNVLRNAVRFTHGGGSIIVRTSNDGDRRLLVSITDNGIGIAKEDIERIFAAFDQGTSGHRFGGLGLGLAISRSLVEAHGGSMCVESDGPGCGATFTIELPIEASAMRVVPMTDGVMPVATAAPALRILLVEDHEPTRVTLNRLLQRRGHRVETAGSIAGARTLTTEQAFDLVISDLGLPDGDGCELMSELAAVGGPPGVALSGYGMEEDVERSRVAGFTAHLTKPVDMEALDRVLSNWPVGKAAEEI